MKIIRDGKEIELTNNEVYAAYKEYHGDCFREDVLGKIEEAEMDISDELLDKIIRRAEKTLDNNDSYWESYWISIEYAIEETLKNN